MNIGIDFVIGDSVDMAEAVERGWVKCYRVERVPRNKEQEEIEMEQAEQQHSAGPKQQEIERDFLVSGVRDPKTGKVLSLQVGLLNTTH